MTQFPNGVRQTLQRPTGDGYATDAQFAFASSKLKLSKKTSTSS